jgi:hypothetical protein
MFRSRVWTPYFDISPIGPDPAFSGGAWGGSFFLFILYIRTIIFNELIILLINVIDLFTGRIRFEFQGE